MTSRERKNAATFLASTTAIPFSYMGGSFKCFYCLKPFSEAPEVLEHTAKHSIRSKNDIFERFLPRSKRICHVDITELKCRICDKKYSTLNKIREHLIKVHGKEFCLASNGLTEFRMELINGMLVCHICLKEFHNFGLLNQHMDTHDFKVICERCGQGFRNQHALFKHNESHLSKTFPCKFCDKEFFKRGQVRYHISAAHLTNKRPKKKCPKCPETFNEQYSKVTHLRQVHGIVRTFVCHICKEEFIHRRSLSEHANKYHLERFKCDICSKCFSREPSLTQHKAIHRQSLTCPVCKQAFTHMVRLKKHMRTHEKPT